MPQLRYFTAGESHGQCLIGVIEGLPAGLKLELRLASQELPAVFADAARVRQVLLNLAGNSLKFTPQNGTVKMMLADEGKEFVITVADTGVGISEADIPYIFERFFRADQSRNKKTGGSGIGLAIVKSIVEAHGGRIGVESHRDVGSSFKIYLPKE